MNEKELIKYRFVIDGRPQIWISQIVLAAVMSGPLGVTGYGNAVIGFIGLIVGVLGSGSLGYYAHVKKGVIMSIVAFIGGILVYTFLTGLFLSVSIGV